MDPLLQQRYRYSKHVMVSGFISRIGKSLLLFVEEGVPVNRDYYLKMLNKHLYLANESSLFSKMGLVAIQQILLPFLTPSILQRIRKLQIHFQFTWNFHRKFKISLNETKFCDIILKASKVVVNSFWGGSFFKSQYSSKTRKQKAVFKKSNITLLFFCQRKFYLCLCKMFGKALRRTSSWTLSEWVIVFIQCLFYCIYLLKTTRNRLAKNNCL